MNIIKKVSLYYQKGTSDKVYEIDLVQNDDGKYLVNFRYGRRGKSLLSGTKTDKPTSLQEAEKIYNKLLQSKLKEGYIESKQGESQTVLSSIVSKDPLEKALFELNDSNEKKRGKAVNKLFGIVLKKKDVANKVVDPLLNALKDTSPLVRYNACLILGKIFDDKLQISASIKDRKSEVISKLTPLLGDNSSFIRRIVYEALRRMNADAVVNSMVTAVSKELPPEVNNLLEKGDANAIKQLIDYVNNQKSGFILEQLYQINSPPAREVLKGVLQNINFIIDYWTHIKSIYKMAEQRRDAEIFGILAYRFETTKGNSGYAKYDSEERKWIRNPYKASTQKYMRRRTWRYLKSLAKEEPDSYAINASSFLSHFKDSDGKEIKQVRMYDWKKGKTVLKSVIDKFCYYWTFNYILYSNSKRYFCPSATSWRCTKDYQPGQPDTNEREEAFPELWEKDYKILLDLICKSECEPVHQFAIKILREKFYSSIKDMPFETLSILLQKPYKVTQNLGIDIAKARFVAYNPDRNLINTLLNSTSIEIRELGCRWLRDSINYWKDDIAFLLSLFESKYEDIRNTAIKLTNEICKFAIQDYRNSISGKLINTLLRPEKFEGIYKSVIESLRSTFWDDLKNTSISKVFLLITSESPLVQELGGELLSHSKEVDPNKMEWTMLSNFANHKIVTIRQSAFKMIEDTLERWRKDIALILSLVESEWDDTRQFAFNLLRERFKKDEFTPDMLIGLCDSTRLDVQDFGKEMITNYFKDGYQPDYVMRLTEHPHLNMHQFAIDLVVNHLPIEPDRIKSMELFFRAILFRVNKGRAMKDKLFAFFETCGMKDKDTANAIVPILADFSHSLTKKDFSNCLKLITKIKTKYPDISYPIKIIG